MPNVVSPLDEGKGLFETSDEVLSEFCVVICSTARQVLVKRRSSTPSLGSLDSTCTSFPCPALGWTTLP